MESVPLTREWTIACLVEAEAEIRALGVARLALFGSVLRNLARPNSDVDVLVQFSRSSARHILTSSGERWPGCATG